MKLSNIHEQYCNLAAPLPPYAPESLIKAVDEQLAVGQVGEVVVEGLIPQALFGLLTFSDIGDLADVQFFLSRASVPADINLYRDDLAVLF